MKKLLFAACVLGLALTGCQKDPGQNPDKINPGVFDYATTRVGNIDVKYDLTGYRSGILFEVYAEFPFNTNGSKKDIKALFKAYTDDNGHFSGPINLPTYLQTVWVVTDAFVANNATEVAVTNGSISCQETITTSRSGITRALVNGAHHSFPEEFFPMNGSDDWNELGVPSYLNLHGRTVIPATLLEDINAIIPSGQKMQTGPSAYLTDPNCLHDISIISPAKIKMSFLFEGAGFTNTIGYYTYPTGQAPTSPSQIVHRTIVFPNATADKSVGYCMGGTGGLIPGDNAELLYWNGTEYVETFPAGVTIGFFIQSCGFSGPGPYTPQPYTYGIRDIIYTYDQYNSQRQVFYSTAALNYQYVPADQMKNVKSKQHTVALYDYKVDNRAGVVIGFEDWPTHAGSDMDYNDVVFYIQTNPASAIDVPDGREDDLDPTPDPKKGYELEYEGTLAFEDLWPYRGDYDMNDVGIKYHSKVYYNADNKIYKTEDTFTPVSKGGKNTNGFGFQYGVMPSEVKSCVLNRSAGAPVADFPTLSGMALEAGQSKAVVMLFKDINPLLTGNPATVDKSQQQPLHSYTVVTEFNDVTAAQLGFPPYNPFIISQPSGTQEDQRSREVHLTNMRPTDKCTDAANKWFGKGQDKSDKVNFWYVSADNFPFAINIPTGAFRFPKEYQRIDIVYDRFANWVITKGAEDADWWK